MVWRSPGGLSYHLAFLFGFHHSGLCLTSGRGWGRRAVSRSRAAAECVTQRFLNCFEDFKIPSHLLRWPCPFSSGCLQHQGAKNTFDTGASLTSVGEKAAELANCWATSTMLGDKVKSIITIKKTCLMRVTSSGHKGSGLGSSFSLE